MILSSSRSPRQGLTILETLISVTIFGLAATIVFTGIIAMARQQASTASQQRIENAARRLMTAMTTDSSDATGIGLETTATLNRQRVIINRPTELVAYEYNNGDGSDATIENNVIRRAAVPTGTAVAEQNFRTLVPLVSPQGSNPVFAIDTRTSSTRPLLNVLVRVGDRSAVIGSAERRANDAQTGRGFQSYLVDFAISKGDRVAP